MQFPIQAKARHVKTSAAKLLHIYTNTAAFLLPGGTQYSRWNEEEQHSPGKRSNLISSERIQSDSHPTRPSEESKHWGNKRERFTCRAFIQFVCVFLSDPVSGLVCHPKWFPTERCGWNKYLKDRTHPSLWQKGINFLSKHLFFNLCSPEDQILVKFYSFDSFWYRVELTLPLTDITFCHNHNNLRSNNRFTS